MSKAKKLFGYSALAVIIIAVGGLALSWQSAIEPLHTNSTQSFTDAQIAHGEKLAALGDCAVCHTRPGGEKNTGGFAMEIPFGTIYTTNITPDIETGIGSWSYEAFERAMRYGVDREGNYLYPAFPYTAFTHTSDDDLYDLYAWLMSQKPVRYQPPKTSLNFPFNIRQGIWAWNQLYLTAGPIKPNSSQTDEWNRGAYLTEGLGHCSACHSPRDILFGEKGGDSHLMGGDAEGWSAPALRGDQASPVAWSHQDMAEFLRTGFSANHGVAAGPMAPVIREGTSQLTEEDRQAIATYLTSEVDHPQVTSQAVAIVQQTEDKIEPLSTEGARLYSGACMACHAQTKGAQMSGVRPALALNTNLYADTPDNAIRVVLNGIEYEATEGLGSMPAFRHNLSDQQIAVLLNYLRTTFTDKSPWPDLEQQVSQLRAETATK
ncbi:cytochrome c [Providencia hangzhouensis]|uniref:Cytochrome c n=1 Tax=Providencia rettgeri TaxID=587 RepID=A0AAJ4TJ37_PRORE|nr:MULTISPECIES: cytochrome c [Providencia]MBJ9971844.1 cytochrome c [Providencia rettgeri]MCF8963947.1 Nicotinate dehydrogenase subunit B [Providencia rettgeri]QWQ17817.1 cytochrome c [Providencia rettgeri]QWQ21651.1 cytochrome c [Providencia rettgeri]QWQ25490.1 cytochrome c [Providencia rettgeri]